MSFAPLYALRIEDFEPGWSLAATRLDCAHSATVHPAFIAASLLGVAVASDADVAVDIDAHQQAEAEYHRQHRGAVLTKTYRKSCSSQNYKNI
jgi:hypothetical protein